MDVTGPVEVNRDDRLARTVDDLAAVIATPGRAPGHHARVIARHRAEWPMLWDRIDAVIAARRAELSTEVETATRSQATANDVRAAELRAGIRRARHAATQAAGAARVLRDADPGDCVTSDTEGG